MSPVQPTREIRSLTGLRGVAAMYVLVFHYFPIATYNSPLRRVLGHGYLAVDLFFVLSGFVMALNYRHLFESGWTRAAYGTFLARRIARIYPLYIVATVVGFVLVVAGGLPFIPTMPRAPALIFNLLMVQSWGLTPSFDSPAWSISAEWAAYLLFPALLIPSIFRKPAVALLCTGLAASLLAALCALPAALFPDTLVRDPLNMSGHAMGLPVLRCVPEFTLGILAFRFASTSLGRRLVSSVWIAPALVLSALFVLTIPGCDLAFVLLLPVLVVSLASEAHLPGRILASAPLEFLGLLSFSIYLTHKLLFGLLTWMYEHAHTAGIPHARTLSAGVCLILTFAISYAAFSLIEVPGRRWLRAISDRIIRRTPVFHAETTALADTQALEPVSR